MEAVKTDAQYVEKPMFHVRFILAVLMACLSSNVSATTLDHEANSDTREKQRKIYLQAVEAFSDRDLRYYQTLKAQLANYPLYPYLLYRELSYKLDTSRSTLSKDYQKTAQRINQFLQSYKSSYLEKRLRVKWLKHLAKNKNWKDYAYYYQPYLKNTTLQCHYWTAILYTRGILEADAVQSLWLKGKSQPDECDVLFKKWEHNGHLTQELLWERHKLTINKGNYQLAHYLQKKMLPATKYLATLYEKTHRQPATIKNVKRFKSYKHSEDKSSQQLIDIIYHGIYRYAYREPAAAYDIFSTLKDIYTFNDDEQKQLVNRISTRFIRNGEIDAAKPLIKTLPASNREEQIERLLRHYLALENWPRIIEWIDHLPRHLAESERWLYWKARALQETGTSGHKDIFQQVAKTRGYYGFLAADIQQSQYKFEDKPAPVKLDIIKEVKSLPALQRSREFYLLGDYHKARVEWSYARKNFSPMESIAAGQLAHLWGWNRKAIESMAKAGYWDDLTIRFPVVHQHIVHEKATDNNLSSSLIFSIARQESAWEHDARSRLGARGLMQIMPETAKQTAKKAKIRYSKRKLLDPEYNITLGSHYISYLLKKHNNNRPLAIASYNAGPHRVKRWLEKSNAQLDTDTWIEIIPFNETRKYVQNVLSYEVIYNYRQGQHSKLLTLAEANTDL